MAESQVTVVGAGAAGLYAALCAARAGEAVMLVCPTPLAQSSSYWAQGGLAAAVGASDSVELHLQDTLRAGRGVVRQSAARVLCEEAPGIVENLRRLGVRFDTDRHGQLLLGLEGGHSVRRVVHAGGAATGRRLVAVLSHLVGEHERIEVLEGRRVQALVVHDGRCHGVVLDGGRDAIAADATVLATGGAAALWARTTNPPGAFGGGLMLALAVGATLADLEFMQFHPTALAVADGADGLLVSEAVRGEGAKLLDESGKRFVDELAPRDEVARAIARRLTSSAARAVDLDMRDVDPELFPDVVGALRRAGIDPVHELVPVAPAAHYMMGGVATDLVGRSSLPGLYAVGECSDTGLHGANRLASNSLTECFVFAARAARAAAGEPAGDRRAVRQAGGRSSSPIVPPRPSGRATLRKLGGIEHPIVPPRPSSRATLWKLGGIERHAEGLRQLAEDPHPLIAVIARCALARTESRGAHQRCDFPQVDPALDGLHVTVRHGEPPTLQAWR